MQIKNKAKKHFKVMSLLFDFFKSGLLQTVGMCFDNLVGFKGPRVSRLLASGGQKPYCKTENLFFFHNVKHYARECANMLL